MANTSDVTQALEEDPEALRTALIDQMGHLVDEIEALETVVGGMPDEILEGRPAPDVLTMKELYGALATLDAEVRRPRIDRIVNTDTPTLSPVDVDETVRNAGWNERKFETILDRVKTARRRLVDRLEALPVDVWRRTATLDGETRTLFEFVHRIIQEDVDRLRALGYRLHGAHLSDRDEPLPT